FASTSASAVAPLARLSSARATRAWGSRGSSSSARRSSAAARSVSSGRAAARMTCARASVGRDSRARSADCSASRGWPRARRTSAALASGGGAGETARAAPRREAEPALRVVGQLRPEGELAREEERALRAIRGDERLDLLLERLGRLVARDRFADLGGER